jgi:hypothetical protein
VTEPGDVYEHPIDELDEITGGLPLFALPIDLVIARMFSSVWD